MIVPITILRTVFGTRLQALQGKEYKKVELNAASGVELTLIELSTVAQNPKE
jgi:hypothetical protein